LTKSEPLYLVNTKLEVEIFALSGKENKEERGDLEGKVYAPYLGILSALPPLLNLKLAFLKTPGQ